MSDENGFPKNNAIIQCTDVHKWFDEFHALRGVDMEVEKGEFVPSTVWKNISAARLSWMALS
jgi:ABC-type histidine transport system ATPase subunit